MSRQDILGRIRTALAVSMHDNAARYAAVRTRLTSPPRVPSPSAPAHEPNIVNAFSSRLVANGAFVATLQHCAEIRGQVAAYLTAEGLPLTLHLAARLADAAAWQRSGLACREGPVWADDVAALSLAVAGIAETGTLVLSSANGTPGLAAFLPETHIVAVEQRTIYPTLEEALDRSRLDPLSASTPRATFLISGASRTGDIGGTIVCGAHGPRRLAVLIVNEPLAGT